VVAAAAGVTAFDPNLPRAWSAYLALTAGVFTAAVGFLRCENSRDRNNALCAGWTHLADEIRYVLMSYANNQKKAQQELRRLTRLKMDLLWGVLRSGPIQPGEVSPNESEPSVNGSSPARMSP
jgi:hypothetical protein